MRLALILALVLPACGGGTDAPGGSPIIEVERAFPSVIGNRAGLTVHGKPTQVLVRAALRGEERRRVLVHELLHAVGIPDHLPCEACYLFATVYPDLPAALCAEEAALYVAAVGREATWEVVVLSEALRGDLAWATGFLNQQAGRTVFRIR